MSLNAMRLRIDPQMRQSFEERIFDDLSADILKFLTFEDKLRLECVSKQFQRTVFLKQTEFPYILQNKSYKNFEKIETIIQKIPNMKEIVIESFELSENINMIILLDKIGPKLVSVKFSVEYHYSFENLSKLIPFQRLINIEELVIVLCRGQTPNLSALQFKRLKKFVLHCNILKKDLHHLEVFIGNHANTIRDLSIIHHSGQWGDLEENIERFLEMIKSVKILRHLTLILDIFPFDFWTYRQIFLSQLAEKCTHLKSLQIQYKFNCDLVGDCTLSYELITPLNYFKGLKRLALCFPRACRCPFLFPDNTFYIFKELNHFIIRIEESETVNEEVFEGIDSHLPNLRSLTVLNRIEATEWLGDILSRITSLESLDINVRNESIMSYIERKLIKNCKRFKRLKRICFPYRYPDISHPLKHFLCRRLHSRFDQTF